MKGRLRLCFVCNEYPPGPHGGIGTFTRLLARALVANGHDVRVIGTYHPDYPAPDYDEDQGVRVWRMRRSPRRFSWIPSRYRLHRTIGQWCKQGLIDYIEFPDFEGWAARLPRFPVPVVVRLHGCATYFADELGRPLNRTTFYLERAGMRRADFWCSVSKYTAERTKDLFNLSTEPDGILYNFVEIPDVQPSSDRSTNQIVYTGTLTEKKGIVSLIRAWPKVCSVVADAELHVFGKDGRTADGQSIQRYLQEQLQETGGNVFFHGHVSRDTLLQKLSIARAAVFPSYAEAFALAPLESMAFGCPTIYSTRGSGRELINDGEDGLLVDPGRPEDIASAIIKLLRDDELAARIGIAGRRRVMERFTVEQVLKQNEAFVHDCIEQFQSRAGRSGKPSSKMGRSRIVRHNHATTA